MTVATETETPTSKEDLRETLQSFQDGVRGAIDDRRQTLVTVGAVVGVTVVVVAYLLGRRVGRRRTTFVEIRRV
jgi:VanZ family protein